MKYNNIINKKEYIKRSSGSINIDDALEIISKKETLKNVPESILNKYFKKISDKENKYKLSSKIKRRVTFEKKDLIYGSFSQKWDLILCRNFFIYLTKKLKKKLIAKFSRVLKPTGYFFLGNTEFIFNPGKYNFKIM